MHCDGAIWTASPLACTLHELRDKSGNTLTACLTVSPRFASVSVWRGGQIVGDHMVRIAGICQSAGWRNWRVDARHMGDISARSFVSNQGRREGEGQIHTKSQQHRLGIFVCSASKCKIQVSTYKSRMHTSAKAE